MREVNFEPNFEDALCGSSVWYQEVRRLHVRAQSNRMLSDQSNHKSSDQSQNGSTTSADDKDNSKQERRKGGMNKNDETRQVIVEPRTLIPITTLRVLTTITLQCLSYWSLPFL